MLWATKKRQRTQKSKWERIQREGAMAGLSRQMFPPHYLSLHLSSADSKRDPFPMGGLTWKSRTRMGKIWEPDRWFTTRTLTEPPTPQPMRFLSPQAYCIGSQALIRRLLAEQRLGLVELITRFQHLIASGFSRLKYLSPYYHMPSKDTSLIRKLSSLIRTVWALMSAILCHSEAFFSASMANQLSFGGSLFL